MSLLPKQIAQRLLSRPATDSKMLGQWLETELPKAIEFIQNSYQVESRSARNGLAIAYNLPGLREELGSAKFEIAFQELLEYAEDITGKGGDKRLRDHLETLHSCRKRFDEIGDMQTQLQADLLPYLQDIAKGEITELNPNYLVELYRNSAALSVRLQKEAPASLHPANAQIVYDTFEKDIKELISYAHKTTGQQMTKQVLAPQNTHVESVQAHNRLHDYWRHRG